MASITIADDQVRSSMSAGPAKSSSQLDDLLPAMRRLDLLLERAVGAAKGAEQADAATDPFRGLHVDPLDVEQLLARQPGDPLFPSTRRVPLSLVLETLLPDSRLAWLRRTFGLSPFDIDVVAMALAPEFDLRYEGLYAYLQDDVTRKRPSVDLALNLLCADADAKLRKRAQFGPDAPLIRHGLLELIPQSHQIQASSLGLAMKLDAQLCRFLLGVPGLDPHLAGCCTAVAPAARLEALFLPAAVKQGLRTLAQQLRGAGKPLSLYLQGAPGLGQQAVAEALALEAGRPLLALDLSRVDRSPAERLKTLRRVRNAARFQQAVLFVEGWDAALTTGTGGQDRHGADTPDAAVLAALGPGEGVIVLTGAQPWPLQSGEWADVMTIPVGMPDYAHRRACWQAQVTAAKIPLSDADLDALADRFRLGPDQIAQAIACACSAERWQTACVPREDAAVRDGEETNLDRDPSLARPDMPGPLAAALFAAARSRSGHELAEQARKIEPRQTWDDLVLPSEPLAQLKEICNQARYRQVVHGDWGFGGKLSSGKGLTVLFSGPPGTGKTMAAEVIAKALELDLYQIDLARIVSKYIGETEKNLNRVFTAAEHANAILLFDEADAIFGKRSEVKDAHDRYANLEVAYLLQKMEAYEGISILTSNLRQNLDEAFTRRIGFIVEFPFPEEPSRLRIWQGIWPCRTPLAKTVDLDLLAKQFKLAGGSIRNIAVAATFLAADEGQEVRPDHLLRATRREFKKMGRLIDEKAFAPFTFVAANDSNDGTGSGGTLSRDDDGGPSHGIAGG